ncbi:hypothetical protein J4233_01115 [Candidatus Pacearchaeota archaeon]|nr:hypothetical protein [Candidatus Pacearchaeota archaeon]
MGLRKRTMLSWEEVVQLSYDLAEQIRGKKVNPDAVVGIHPSGYAPAHLVARELGIPSGLVLSSRAFRPSKDVNDVILINDRTDELSYFLAEPKLHAAGITRVQRAVLVSSEREPSGFYAAKQRGRIIFPWDEKSPFHDKYRQQIPSLTRTLIQHA